MDGRGVSRDDLREALARERWRTSALTGTPLPKGYGQPGEAMFLLSHRADNG
jgi:hypothetical protein